MKLSVVTTLYKSESFLEEFVKRMAKAAECLTQDYEIIMVDDGSPDNSLTAALQLKKTFSRLQIVELSRNFGHHRAMMAGLDLAKGDLVFLIDVDLEEPPELLTKFHEELKNVQCDVIFGVQESRQGGIVKRLGGKIGWWLIELLMPIKITTNQSTVRLMTADYVRALVSHKERATAIVGLWVISGFKQVAVKFQKSSRDDTSYTFLKRLQALLDSITSFSERPLYFIFFLGLGISLLSVLVSGVLIYIKLSGAVLSGWVSVMISVWMLGGLIILCLGTVGLYISRIFIETKHRPYVIIRKIYP